jgi:hypothetical protein
MAPARAATEAPVRSVRIERDLRTLYLPTIGLSYDGVRLVRRIDTRPAPAEQASKSGDVAKKGKDLADRGNGHGQRSPLERLIILSIC